MRELLRKQAFWTMTCDQTFVAHTVSFRSAYLSQTNSSWCFMHKLLRYFSNQIFNCTRCITPKRVTSLQGPSPRHCVLVTQLLSKKCFSCGERLTTMCPTWPTRDLNHRPPAPKWTLPLDRLVFKFWIWKKIPSLVSLHHESIEVSFERFLKETLPASFENETLWNVLQNC